MKTLAVDYGTKRIGLAISDESATLARELSIVSPAEFWNQLEQLLHTEGVERIIIGNPLNMSGQATEKTIEAQKFAEQLKTKVLLPIELVDERLSSQMAEQISGTKVHIDSLAAQIFLQNYLDSQKSS